MERFFTHAGRYVRLDVTSRHFLEYHGQLQHFSGGDYFLLHGESRRYWCFVLSGMAAGVDQCDRLGAIYRFVVLPDGYFTGTRHPFSQRDPGLFIQFLRPTALFSLPLDAFRYAQERMPPFGNFVQVLKQRHMTQQEAMAEVLAAPKVKRYAALHKWLPDHFSALTDRERMRLMRVDRATYYKAKAAFGR